MSTKRLTLSIIITRFEQKHGKKYGYELVEYTKSMNTTSKVPIICTEHGIFEQKISHHMNGVGCRECQNAKMRRTLPEFIKESNEKHHNKYGYDNFVYIKDGKRGEIICPEHGSFYQSPANHLSGRGCPVCGDDSQKLKCKKTINHFIKESNEKHHNKYGYDNFVYMNNHTKGNITCHEHGDFSQSPTHHLSGRGCPKCSSSKGEILIEQWLRNNNINNKMQKKFKDCRDKRLLSFDFYLPKQNICIEYDGIQHYEPVAHFGGEKTHLNVKRRDAIKTKYCKDNNIKLIRIPYTETNVEAILKDILVCKR